MSSVIVPEQSDIFGARALGGRPTGCIALADGSLFFGQGFGATGAAHFAPDVPPLAAAQPFQIVVKITR